MNLLIGVIVGAIATALFYRMFVFIHDSEGGTSRSFIDTSSRYITASPQIAIASLLHFTYNIGEHELKVWSQNGTLRYVSLW